MKIKLAITGGIFLVGAILFMPQTLDLFPNAPEVFNSAKKDISGIQKEVLDSLIIPLTWLIVKLTTSKNLQKTFFQHKNS